MISFFVFKIRSGLFSPIQSMDWHVPMQGGVLGRALDCDWVLEDNSRVISRQHAKVHVENDQCFWTDLATNGTFLNGKPMPTAQPTMLNPGDVLMIGDYSISLTHGPEKNQSTSDPLVFLSSGLPVEMSIDDLLAEAPVPVESQLLNDSMYFSPLSNRMYVGPQSTGFSVASSPALSDNVVLCGREMAGIRNLLRISVECFMQLLQARRVFKTEMGSEFTTLSSQANNPLKFAKSVDEAMTLLLGPSSPAYLLADQAFEQACKDILACMQLSVAQAQAVIENVQSTLDPQVIVGELLKTGGLGRTLTATRKAHLWDLYCERYKSMEDTWS